MVAWFPLVAVSGIVMTRPLWLLCLSLSLAAGCYARPTGAVGGRSTEPRPPTPSPEAVVILRQLGHVDGDGKAEVRGYVAEKRLARLEAELRKVGARSRPDGKVYDRTGRLVHVEEDGPGPGAQIDLEPLRREHEAKVRELRKRFTVIELPYYGPPAP
jgi:hypothetical protein